MKTRQITLNLMGVSLLFLTGCSTMKDPAFWAAMSQSNYQQPPGYYQPPYVPPRPAVQQSGAYVGVGQKHWVSEKIDSGAFIMLEDRSLWQISPIDKINTMLWLPTDNVVVIESRNPQYPYRLVGERDTAEAKLVSQ